MSFALILGLTFATVPVPVPVDPATESTMRLSDPEGTIKHLNYWLKNIQEMMSAKIFETPGYPFCSYLANIYGPIPDYQEGYRHANPGQKAQLRQLDHQLMDLLLQVKMTYFPNETCAGSGFDSTIRLFFPAQ